MTPFQIDTRVDAAPVALPRIDNPFFLEAAAHLEGDGLEWSANNYFDWQKKYAYEIPTPQAIEMLIRHCPRIVEIGAGKGYWAYVLDQAGIDILPFDIAPPDDGWRPVASGSHEVLSRNSDRALLLCWPPYKEAMAAECLRAYLEAGGQTLAYAGEGYRGCTADDDFFTLKCTRFERVEQVYLQSVPNTSLEVLRRKS